MLVALVMYSCTYRQQRVHKPCSVLVKLKAQLVTAASVLLNIMQRYTVCLLQCKYLPALNTDWK